LEGKLLALARPAMKYKLFLWHLPATEINPE
jgi:hypothetical protein